MTFCQKKSTKTNNKGIFKVRTNEIMSNTFQIQFLIHIIV